MSKATKASVSKKLQQTGGAWATSNTKYIDPNDGFGAAPTWHIHPDRSYPHENQIRRFDTLAELDNHLDNTLAFQNGTIDAAELEYRRSAEAEYGF